MRTTLTTGLVALISQASGHYIFQTFSTSVSTGTPFEYVRENSNYNSPVTELDSPDLRCNVGGGSGAGTGTIEVAAGDSVQFTSDIAVYHNGPTSIYMAKAPSAAADFDGSGDVWFKIKDWGATFPGGSWDLSQTYGFEIPSCIPAGEYLVRIQQLGIHNPWPAGTPQFYIACAQVKVTGSVSGDLGPKVAIPGAFSESDPGYTTNIYNNFNNYTVPGPSVATC